MENQEFYVKVLDLEKTETLKLVESTKNVHQNVQLLATLSVVKFNIFDLKL